MTDTSLLEDFITESVEHLEDMETKLLQLESDPENHEILNDIFRSIHTIKGASDYMGLERIAELAHKLENLLDLLRKNEITFTDNILDTLITARDRIVLLIGDLELTQSEETTIDDVLKLIKSFIDNPNGSDSNEASSELTEEISETSYDPEIMEEFISEVREYLEEMETSLILIEDNPENKEAFNEFFRAIHTIKGAADYMGVERISALSQQLESFLLKIRQEELILDVKMIQLIAAVPKRIALLIGELERAQMEETEIDDLSDAIRNLSEKGENEDFAVDDMMVAEDDVAEEEVLVEEEDDDLFDDEYNEEYDEELFDIFLEQLQESISRLSEIDYEMLYDNNQVGPVLEKYIDCIQGLYSSANYMGYEKLANYYEKWTEELYAVLKTGHPGEGLDWRDYIATKINSRINKIIKLFPQLQVDFVKTDLPKKDIINVNEEPADIFENVSVLGKEADEIAEQAELSDMDTSIGQIDTDTDGFDDSSVLGEEASLFAISDNEFDLDEEGMKIAEVTDEMDIELENDEVTEELDEYDLDPEADVIATEDDAKNSEQLDLNQDDEEISENFDEFDLDIEDEEIDEGLDFKDTDGLDLNQDDEEITESFDEFDLDIEDEEIDEDLDSKGIDRLDLDQDDEEITESFDEFDLDIEDEEIDENLDSKDTDRLDLDQDDEEITESFDEFDLDIEDEEIDENLDSKDTDRLDLDQDDEEITESFDEFDLDIEDEEIDEGLDSKDTDRLDLNQDDEEITESFDEFDLDIEDEEIDEGIDSKDTDRLDLNQDDEEIT
ncbi:Hpt domain-containing protein, partial [Desulfococcaceae bacterium HSG9]|nr:Hpt domain-containing protein [Desulfococcaceae bacterium HSG9]